MLGEVAAICAAIPHADRRIQWDVCVEVVMGRATLDFPALSEQRKGHPDASGRLMRCGSADVEVGLPLCYGDLDAKHFIEPSDMGPMVSLANAVTSVAKHPLACVHMPVPITVDDDAYFAPLASLAIGPETEVFLGLVHGDAPDNSRRRIEAASNYASGFGIATECGMARKRTPEMVRDLLNARAAASREPTP
jgi:hypothetical protein